MILGDTCTRRCGFCNVQTGKPTWNDPLEPARVARSIARMGLRHAVITSVDRDDLPDYGAGIWAATIRQVRRQAPDCQVEVLTPDFRGQEMPLAKVIAERPDVFNHNVEVVPRLYPIARRGSRWERSLRVLENGKHLGGDEVTTKSGLMVGLGETHDEVVDAFGHLRAHGVQVITIGQYLRPTERHLPVVRYWHPDEFKALEEAGLRARLRPRRLGAARPLELPRRPARPPAPRGRRAAGRRGLLAGSLGPEGGGQPALAHGGVQRRPVGLGPVGVGLGEARDRPVEGVALAEVGRERDAVPGAGVGPGQRPAARARVALQRGGTERRGDERAAPLAQAPHHEGAPGAAGRRRHVPEERSTCSCSA